MAKAVKTKKLTELQAPEEHIKVLKAFASDALNAALCQTFPKERRPTAQEVWAAKTAIGAMDLDELAAWEARCPGMVLHGPGILAHLAARRVELMDAPTA